MENRPANLQSGDMPDHDDWNNLVEKAWTPPAPQLVDLRAKNSGDSAVRCLGLLAAAVDGGAGPWDVDHVSSVSGANPLVDPEDDTEVVQVLNPFGFVGDDNEKCLFSKAKEANAALSIAAGDFIFDTIACPTGT